MTPAKKAVMLMDALERMNEKLRTLALEQKETAESSEEIVFWYAVIHSTERTRWPFDEPRGLFGKAEMKQLAKQAERKLRGES